MPTAVLARPPRPFPASLKSKPQVQASHKSVSASIISAPPQLPVTALASIFLLAALGRSSRTYVDPSSLSKQTKATILSISHVDPLFRAISLTIPDLWLFLLICELDAEVNEAEYPLYRRKEWLKELLRRSNPLPIDVGSMGYSYLPRDPELIGLELGNLHRIRTYRVLLDERGWETLASCLGEPAERLESMSLAFKPSVFNRASPRLDLDECFIPSPQLPRNFLNNFSPRLSKLSLRGGLPFSGDFSSRALSNLRSLTVAQIGGPSVPTAERWIAYLSNMPRLEHLTLEEGAISWPRKQKRLSNPSHTTSEASLTALNSLTLEGVANAVASILRRLVFPERCTLSVKCLDVVETEGAMEVVLSTFATGLECVATSEDPVRFLSFKGDHGMLHVSDGTRSRRLELHFSNDAQGHGLPHSTLLWERHLSKLLASAPLTIASFTTLEVILPSVPQAFVKALSEACQLERLVNLTGGMTKKLLPLLKKQQHAIGKGMSDSSSPSSVVTSDSLSSISPLPILPALHTLHFASLDAFAGDKWDVVRGYLKWRTLGWRAIRVVQAPMAGYGLYPNVEEALEELNVSIIYVH